MRFGFGQTRNILKPDIAVELEALLVGQLRFTLPSRQFRNTFQRFRRRAEAGNLLHRGSASDAVEKQVAVITAGVVSVVLESNSWARRDSNPGNLLRVN